jgi:hypothetical protein
MFWVGWPREVRVRRVERDWIVEAMDLVSFCSYLPILLFIRYRLLLLASSVPEN